MRAVMLEVSDGEDRSSDARFDARKQLRITGDQQPGRKSQLGYFKI